MRTLRTALIVGMALLIASPVFAAQKKEKVKKEPPCPAAQRVDKLLEGLTLTAEQQTKLGEIKKEFGPKLMEALKAADVLTPEQKKVAAEAAKAAKAAGKKGKELGEAVAAAVKLTDDQKAKQAEAKKQVGELEKQLREKTVAVLSPEQKEQIKKAHAAKAKK
jgi:Spy/CpxP family protein refolding chaperone